MSPPCCRAQMASFVGQLDENAVKRKRKLQAIRDYVRVKRVPQFVRERVIDFCEIARAYYLSTIIEPVAA